MRKSLVVALAGAALVSSVGVPATLLAPAVADASPSVIQYSHDMAVDTVRGQVFISEDVANELLVADAAGDTVDTLSMKTPTDLQLSPDSSTLYVVTGNGLEAVDTTTFAVSAVPTDGVGCLQTTAFAAGLLWFTYGCSGADLGAIDLSTDTVTTGLGSGLDISGEATMLADATHLPNTLVIGSETGSPGGVSIVSVTAGSTPSATQTAHISHDSFTVMQLTPDGSQVLIPNESEGVTGYSTTDLHQVSQFGAPMEVNSIAYRADGMLALGGTVNGAAYIKVFLSGETHVLSVYEYSEVARNGLAFGTTKLFAVAAYDLQALVPKHATTLTVHANHTSFSYGEIATVTAHLGSTYSNRTVTIYATPYRGDRRVVKSGVVNSAGDLVGTTKVFQRVTFTAAFTGDDLSTAAVATQTITTAAQVTSALQGGYAWSGAYRLYHTSEDPIEYGKVAPNRAGGCLYFHVQFRYPGQAWGYDAWTKCDRLDSQSEAGVRIVGTHHLDEEIRIMAVWRGSILNDPAHAVWRYIRFASGKQASRSSAASTPRQPAQLVAPAVSRASTR